MSINRIVLIGRLTADPELKYSSNGVAICNFILAVDRTFANSNGEREADFIKIVTFKGLAENCANYLKKGKLAAADGRLQIRNYEKDGKKVYVSEVVADNVRFLEKADNTQTNQNTNTGQTKASDDPFANDGKPIDISDDDLPF